MYLINKISNFFKSSPEANHSQLNRSQSNVSISTVKTIYTNASQGTTNDGPKKIRASSSQKRIEKVRSDRFQNNPQKISKKILQQNSQSNPTNTLKISQLKQSNIQQPPQENPQIKSISIIQQKNTQNKIIQQNSQISQQNVPKIPQNNSQNTTIPIPKEITQKNIQMIEVQFEIIGSQNKLIKLNNEMTGAQLKRYIFQSLSTQLAADSMSLWYEGTKITKDMKLKQLRIVVGGKLKIIQTKIDISQVSAIIADAHGIDPLTDETGTAKMSCGHHIGKDSMTMLVRSLIQNHKYQIRCPNQNQDNLPCQALWCFNVCRKIGVFTKTEIQEFQNGLSLNWIKQNAKGCPKCKESISKYQLDSNRVKCPKCKFGDFCYLCLNSWKGPDKKFCGNEQCKFLNEFVSNSPWNRTFSLIDKSDGNKRKNYLTPQYRACVHCSTIIEHGQACKHMVCRSCKKKFCWVCLSVPKNGPFPCGEFNEYCGKVAQAQKFGKAQIIN